LPVLRREALCEGLVASSDRDAIRRGEGATTLEVGEQLGNAAAVKPAAPAATVTLDSTFNSNREDGE